MAEYQGRNIALVIEFSLRVNPAIFVSSVMAMALDFCSGLRTIISVRMTVLLKYVVCVLTVGCFEFVLALSKCLPLVNIEFSGF